MSRRHNLALAVSTLVLSAGAASALDVHSFWDSRCVECHGHAGQFARAHLKVVDGRLAGASVNRDLARFLTQHESSGAYAKPLYDMLLAQAQTPPLFQQKCSGCHGTAASYALANLVLDDGVAKTRIAHRPVVEVLARHGKVTADEARTIAASLARVLVETDGGKGG